LWWEACPAGVSRPGGAFVSPQEEWDRGHEPDRCEERTPAGAREKRGAGERAYVVEHMRRDPDEGTPGGEYCFPCAFANGAVR